MFSLVSTILLIASLILGGGGVTIAAAQNNQPDQPLYGVKVWSEDVRLGVSTDPQSEYQIALEFTGRRAQEIQTMFQAGRIPPQTVQTRYQAQIEKTIQYALNLSDNEAVMALNKICVQLQTQQQSFLHVQANGSPNAESALLQTRQMLQDRLLWVETGLIDPAKLRDQLHLRDQTHQQDPLSSVQPTQAVPGTGIGNPWTTGTPTPGSSYGPGKGTGECESCTPIATGQGGNPWTTGTPTPGSGYGPGPGQDPTRTCTPGSGSNSQPTRLQNNQPTQAGPQQQQNNQPAQVGPQTGQGSGSPSSGPGPQATSGSGNSGGKH